MPPAGVEPATVGFGGRATEELITSKNPCFLAENSTIQYPVRLGLLPYFMQIFAPFPLILYRILYPRIENTDQYGNYERVTDIKFTYQSFHNYVAALKN